MTTPAQPSTGKVNQIKTPLPCSLRGMIETSLDRRVFMNVAMVGTCSALMNPSGQGSSAVATEAIDASLRTTLFHFKNVPPSQSDTLVVPEGYVAEVLYRWGDPINGTSPQFCFDASNTADDQSIQAGMGHDGMEFFAIPGKNPNERGLLAVNHEYTDQVLLFSDGLAPFPPALMPMEKVRKSKASHGVSIVEIVKSSTGKWSIVDSPLARRITADTPMSISGPAKSVVGDSVRGTINNCAAGRTPWGTYLTCEENFHGVFGTRSDSFLPNLSEQRYGLRGEGHTYLIDGQKVGAYRWWEQDRRFDLANADNDSNRFGYVVEIDPFSPDSKPISPRFLASSTRSASQTARTVSCSA